MLYVNFILLKKNQNKKHIEILQTVCNKCQRGSGAPWCTLGLRGPLCSDTSRWTSVSILLSQGGYKAKGLIFQDGDMLLVWWFLIALLFLGTFKKIFT